MSRWTQHTVHERGCDGRAPLIARVYRDAGGYRWDVVRNGVVVVRSGWRLRLRGAQEAADAELERQVQAEQWRGEDRRSA